jgi:purine-binding chemotaxis protein CheW
MSDAFAMSPPPSTVKLACFMIGDATYALEVECVREIVRMAKITPLPNAPELIEGVIDLRGNLIPVLDLARVLGRGEGQSDSRARVAVLDFSGLVFGLWVDSASQVLTLDASRLEDVPELASHAGYDAVSSIVRREGESPVMVLSLDSVIESIYRSAPSRAPMGDPTQCH